MKLKHLQPQIARAGAGLATSAAASNVPPVAGRSPTGAVSAGSPAASSTLFASAGTVLEKCCHPSWRGWASGSGGNPAMGPQSVTE